MQRSNCSSSEVASRDWKIKIKYILNTEVPFVPTNMFLDTKFCVFKHSAFFFVYKFINIVSYI